MPELTRPTQAELDSMSPAEKDALILLLFDLLARHEPRLSEVEGKVEKTSQNSSQPPSSDGFKKGPAKPRQPGDKPLGGQPGHPGATRERVDHPDEVWELRPSGRCGCGVCLDGLAATQGARRQQIEILEPKTVLTEVRQLWGECTSCGLAPSGEVPAGVTPNLSFGPRLKAYAVGLVQGPFVALERTGESLADQYGVQPSEGTVQNGIIKAGQLLAADSAANQQSMLNADVAHFDASGMRIGGQLNWLHVAATETTGSYTVHAKRGQEAMAAAGLLPKFQGHAVHDHWKSYWSYSPCAPSLCTAHYLRELRDCEELTGPFWPIAIRRLRVEGKEAVAAARAAGKPGLEPAQVDELLARYDAPVKNCLAACPVSPPALGRKGRGKPHEATNRRLRRRDYKPQGWRFLTAWRVPFDNNRAERAVRPATITLKVIGGFRARGGSQAFCILGSVWETSKLNGIKPLETRRRAFGGR